MANYKIENFIVKTRNDKISWKETAMKVLELLNLQNTPCYIDEDEGLCPNCHKRLMQLGDEIFCEDENCDFDKILSSDMWYSFVVNYNVPSKKYLEE